MAENEQCIELTGMEGPYDRILCRPGWDSPLSTRCEAVTVAWHSLNQTHQSGRYNHIVLVHLLHSLVRMGLSAGTD